MRKIFGENIDLLLIGLAAAFLSFASIRDLALKMGINHYLAWLYPIVIDIYAYASTRRWLYSNKDSRDKRLARLNSIFAIFISVFMNGLDHMFLGNKVTHLLLFKIFFTSIPPITFANVLHLGVSDKNKERGKNNNIINDEHVPIENKIPNTREPINQLLMDYTYTESIDTNIISFLDSKVLESKSKLDRISINILHKDYLKFCKKNKIREDSIFNIEDFMKQISTYYKKNIDDSYIVGLKYISS